MTAAEPQETFLADHDRAVEALGPLNTQHRRLMQRKAKLDREIADCEAAIQLQLRNLLVEHERVGNIGISHMGNGSLVYWIPDEPDEPRTAGEAEAQIEQSKVEQLADAIDRKGPEYA